TLLHVRGRPVSQASNFESTHYMSPMCGRVIQSSGPLRYAIVDGINVRDSRVHNYPPRWNGAPSQDLLVIRRNHKTGEVSLDPLRWGLIPKDPTSAEWIRTFAIITTEANELVANIHHRMPLILT